MGAPQRSSDIAPDPPAPSASTYRWPHFLDGLVRRLGGPERATIIITLGCILGMDGADKGAVGAMAAPLQQSFGIGRTELGFLLTISLGAAAATTIFFGWLVDRTDRVRLLTFVVAGWAVVMLLSACAPSYRFLLFTRLVLGATAAGAAPAIASLIGDYFSPAERGSVYSSILSGEILGTGAGFLISGELAGWTWRAGFVALAVPAAVLALAVRNLREPARGGSESDHDGRERPGGLRPLIQRAHVEPRSALVVQEDRYSRTWWAVRYVLRIPTNRVLIAASGLGYFYFTGVRTFGVEFLHGWFDVGHAEAIVLVIVAGSGGLIGVMSSGRIADRLIDRGRLDARIVVGVVSYFASAGFLLLALMTRSVWIGVPMLAGAAAALGAANPPLDAARLDIMPPALWGRAESVRTFLRKCAEAAAPIAFGYTTDHVFAGPEGAALRATMLVMLIALGAGGGVALMARSRYPRDVATAYASTR